MTQYTGWSAEQVISNFDRGGTISAAKALELGLYTSYKAAKGEDASNWISNLVDKGVQYVSGDENTSLGTKLYDIINGDENTTNITNSLCIVTGKQIGRAHV